MAPQFKVYVETLGEMADDMTTASQAFHGITYLVDQARVAENAFGFIGERAQFPGKYRKACDTLADGAKASAASLAKATDALLDTAKDYVENDDYYAKRFKIPHDGKAPRIPEIGGGRSAKNEGGGPLQKASPEGQQPQQPAAPTPAPPLPVPATPKLPSQI